MRSLAGELRRLGISGKALIVASHTARKVSEDAWRETFPEAGLDFTVMDFAGECSFAEITRGKEEARRVSASIVVGAGGGKALDTARAIASELDLRVACCPTTASSDAPCSALSVVYTCSASVARMGRATPVSERSNPSVLAFYS